MPVGLDLLHEEDSPTLGIDDVSSSEVGNDVRIATVFTSSRLIPVMGYLVKIPARGCPDAPFPLISTNTSAGILLVKHFYSKLHSFVIIQTDPVSSSGVLELPGNLWDIPIFDFFEERYEGLVVGGIACLGGEVIGVFLHKSASGSPPMLDRRLSQPAF